MAVSIMFLMKNIKSSMNLKFRQAVRDDLPEIVRMLADDFLGAQRERDETPLPESICGLLRKSKPIKITN